MKCVGGPRDHLPVTIKGPDGEPQKFPPGSVLEYRFGADDTGQTTIQVRLLPPEQAPTPSIAGVVETDQLCADGNWHYL
jgi:hypothetical protein